MSYTLFHTHHKPNRYYTEVDRAEVSRFLSGVETPPDNSKNGPTQEQEKACIKGIATAKKIAKQGDIACKPDQENAPNDLSNYFNLGGYTPPKTSENNISMPHIPSAQLTNPNAQEKVIIPQKGPTTGNNNGSFTQINTGTNNNQTGTVGLNTWINGVLQTKK